MTTELVVSRPPREPAVLSYAVFKGLQELYECKLTDLSSNEVDLCDGRFRYFSRETCKHKVTVPFKGDGGLLRAKFNELVEWIAQQTDQPWNVRIEAHHMSQIDFIFTFDELTIGVFFKLVFV